MIREATEKDIDNWCEMRTDLWPDTEDGHRGEITEYFAGSSIDIFVAFIIEVDSKVVGFLELNIRNFAEGSRNSKVPYIEAWYIRPDFQGNGYGKMLMQRAESWAREQGFTELASDTEIHNEKSIAMHTQLGFIETERVVCFLKDIEGR